MYSKLSLSMEKIPRSSGVLCLSLKFGCILTALVYIVYSTLGLAVSVAALGDLDNSPERLFTLTTVVVDFISNGVSFVLSFILLLGLLKEKSGYVRPWILWTTFQTLAFVSLFIITSTIQLMHHDDVSLAVYLIEFAFLVLRLYMLVVVASYYKEMKEAEEDQRFVQQLMSKENWYTEI